jgi:hypothetical protein
MSSPRMHVEIIESIKKVRKTLSDYEMAMSEFESISEECEYYDDDVGSLGPCTHSERTNCTMYCTCQAETCPLLKERN